MRKIGLAAVLAVTVSLAAARDPAQVRAFKKNNPCPYAREVGCIVDHVAPLCAGGLDHPSNMQWQTVRAAKEKDKAERTLCRKRRQPPTLTAP